MAERAREFLKELYELLVGEGTFSEIQVIHFIEARDAELQREARLAEAEWWMKFGCSDDNCDHQHEHLHLAELRSVVPAASTSSEKGERNG